MALEQRFPLLIASREPDWAKIILQASGSVCGWRKKSTASAVTTKTNNAAASKGVDTIVTVSIYRPSRRFHYSRIMADNDNQWRRLTGFGVNGTNRG